MIGLLRHGETEGGPCFRGHADDPLTDVGLAQMRSAISPDQTWKRVISSPLGRCAEFTRLVAKQCSLPFCFDDRLKEMHFGTWEGRTASDLMAECPGALSAFWKDPQKHSPPGGEPLVEFEARVLEAWNEIVSRYADEDVLVVTHGGVIRVLICHVLQLPLAQLLSLEVKHGGLYRIQLGEDGKTLSTTDAVIQM